MKNSGYEYREQIGIKGSGFTISTYLARYYCHSAEAVWRDRIDRGEISLDGRRVDCDTVLKGGQWLLWRRPPWDEPDVPLTYTVLYEDDELLAVAKPSGLPTIPAGGFLEHTLLALVRKSRPEANPIHRLGRGTSGAVLFARTARARSILGTALRKNEITKVYRTLATGVPAAREFSIETPIGPVPHPKLGTVHSVSPGGKYALSRISVLDDRGDTSLLQVGIETGRPHQIRIHLAFAGHPLVGDPLYTIGGALRDPNALPGDCGYLLHAERLSFCHPAKKSSFEIWCPPPPELETKRITHS
ncbi:MAG: RluA family pseudouridine synthase [Syntrophobacteraceae bacterium]